MIYKIRQQWKAKKPYEQGYCGKISKRYDWKHAWLKGKKDWEEEEAPMMKWSFFTNGV